MSSCKRFWVSNQGTGPRSSSTHSTRRTAAPSSPSPSRLTSTRKPRKNTTTRQRRTGARRTGAERGFTTTKDPRQQQHQSRLVPPHGLSTPHAVHHGAAHRPQPAHPRGLERTPARQHPPRSSRARAENPQTAPQDPHQSHRRATMTTSASPHKPRARHPEPRRTVKPRTQTQQQECQTQT
jgi:hypothetical protein